GCLPAVLCRAGDALMDPSLPGIAGFDLGCPGASYYSHDEGCLVGDGACCVFAVLSADGGIAINAESIYA
ncbi:MAG: hypothetical protein PHH05_09525, partial [Syntrophaceticus sp.]|nr:hypothetical protein [Syntrophaceticus sp.]